MNKGRKYSVKLDLCMYDMKAHRTPHTILPIIPINHIPDTHISYIYNYIYMPLIGDPIYLSFFSSLGPPVVGRPMKILKES